MCKFIYGEELIELSSVADFCTFYLIPALFSFRASLSLHVGRMISIELRLGAGFFHTPFLNFSLSTTHFKPYHTYDLGHIQSPDHLLSIGLVHANTGSPPVSSSPSSWWTSNPACFSDFFQVFKVKRPQRWKSYSILSLPFLRIK